jgi:PAS domain S-box-containing protein
MARRDRSRHRSSRKIARDLGAVSVAIYLSAAEAPDYPILYSSPECHDVFGWPDGFETADLQTRISTWIHPDDQEGFRERGYAIEGSTVWDERYRVIDRWGEVHWVHDRAVLVPGDGSRPDLWLGMMADITPVREAQEALLGSEAKYRALVEQVPAVVYEMGPDDERRTLYVSAHVEDILGYSQAEWLDQPDIWIELLHPDDREIELDANDRHNQTGEPWRREYRLIAADGRQVWVRDQAVLIRDELDRPKTWLGVMLDISERKSLEEALRRTNDDLERRVLERTAELAEANEMMSLEIGERRRVEAELRRAEEQYRRLAEHLPVAIYIWEVERPDEDRQGEPSQTYISPQIEQIVGFTPEEWLTSDDFWATRLHPHDRERVLTAARQIAAVGDPFNIEFRYLAKDGRVVWVLAQATLLERDDQSRPKIYQGALIDITARKEAEAKALEAEQRYRALADEAPVIIFQLELPPGATGSPSIRYMGRGVESSLGYAPDRFTDVDAWIEVVHPDDRDLVTDSLASTMNSGAPWSFEHRVIAADGRVVWFHAEATTTRRDDLDSPRSFNGILLDVTEQKEAAERLRESEALLRAHVEGLPAIPFTEMADSETGRDRITFIGPQVQTILGYRPEEFTSEPGHMARMLHPQDRERVTREARRLHRTGTHQDMTYRMIARDGRVVWIRSISQKGTEEAARCVWQGIWIDVSHEHEGAGDQERGVSVRTRSGR